MKAKKADLADLFSDGGAFFFSQFPPASCGKVAPKKRTKVEFTADDVIRARAFGIRLD